MHASPTTTPSFFLVIPCYRESARLPGFLPELCKRLAASDLSIRVQVVDDGSPGDEPALLEQLVRNLRPQYAFLEAPLLLPSNKGKGGAVRAGWDQGMACSHLAFADADGAAPPSEVVRMLEWISTSSEWSRMFIAARIPSPGRSLKRTLFRKFVAKIFNWLIRLCYGIHVTDTQCGLKIVPSELYRESREEMVQCGYAFDLELILAADRRGYPLEIVPIDWEEKPGGTTSAKHALAFLGQLLTRSI